ncbi:MAG: outer membrane protein assembly factor BamD [Bdellovibrionia bacterium]
MRNFITPVKNLTQIWVALAILSTTVFTGTLFSSCSTARIDENDPVSLLNEAEQEIKSDHYQLAVDKLRIIKNKFPYSSAAVDAQLRIADVYFMQESYIESAASYEAFRDLHPKHEKASYAMFRIGKSYYNDIPGTVARDLTPAQKALEAYRNYLANYPSGPDSAEANKDIIEILNLLANKELSIGDFYFNGNFYDSAKPRYKKIIELYPDTQSAKLAQEKLALIDQKASKAKSEEPSKDGRPTNEQ